MNARDLDFYPDELRALYEPKRRLGAGSMGRVYLAVEQRTGTLVAVKVLPHCADDAVEKRLEREARSLARFKHPHVLRVYAFGRTREGPYLVSEYLRGSTLDLVKGEQDVERIGLQLAEGLDAVHKQGLLHRDVKPANVFVTNRGRAVLMDFGLVLDPGSTKLTSTGGMVGTMHYMAPEVMGGESATRLSDWYSWGATLYTVLEGKVPFTRMQIIGALTKKEVPALEFPESSPEHPMRRPIERALSWEPRDRPSSLREVEILAGRIDSRGRPATSPPGRPSGP